MPHNFILRVLVLPLIPTTAGPTARSRLSRDGIVDCGG